MKFQVCFRQTLASVLSLLLLAGASDAFAHGVDVTKPTPAELALVQPALPGSEDFARALLAHYRNKLNAGQVQILDDLGGSLTLAEQIRQGHAHGLGPQDAEFYRWRAETNLLHLLAQAPDLIALDFRQGRPAHPPDSALDIDQQFNLVLLKVVTGERPPRFTVHEMDMTSERDRRPYTVSVGSNATTYVLLKLDQVPSDKSATHLAFQIEGTKEPTLWHALTFASRPLGHLAMEVRDETGQPTPVLLRLTSRAGQRIWEPAGAVDLSPMMNDVTSLPIYGPGRGYMVYVPGPFGGRYWVVPKPFEMALPAGDWEIHILHGIEYEPVHETFSVAAGSWTRKTIRLKRWTNMPARGWYSGDDHVHSRLMSSEDADKLMAFTRAADIHVSNVLEMGNEMRTWYAQRGFGPAFRVQEGIHWLVPGQEDPRSMLGHAIGLNLRSKVRDLDHYYLNDWVAEQIHAQGGLYGHTHVGSGVKSLFTDREVALFTPMNIVDFNSVMQAALGTELFYDMLNLGFKMTASAGSDTPYGGTVGCVRLYAYCGKGKKFTPDAWFAALKAGHTFVSTGPMIEFTVDGALPGDEIRLKSDRPLRVRAKAWGLRGASAPTKLQLVQFGKVLREITPDSADQTELSLDLKVDAGRGCWLAAFAQGQNGSEAHTTPVYVTREGSRFWDVEQAPGLLRKQLAVLDEIEAAITEAGRIVKSGQQPLDYWNRWPAEQAAQIKERVKRIRSVYQELQREVEAESPARATAK
jgi:hypothetical protein